MSKEEDTRTAYEVAAGLYMAENQLTWDRFNVMLVANSVVLAGAGVAGDEDNLFRPAVVSLPIIGILLCIMWVLMMDRGFRYHDHWRDSAELIEDDLNIDEEKKTIKNARLPGILRAHKFAYLVVGLFATVYLSMLIYILTPKPTP
jgi:hypothetical protein